MITSLTYAAEKHSSATDHKRLEENREVALFYNTDK